MQMHKLRCLVLLGLILGFRAAAQQFELPEAAVADPAALSKAMPTLAKQVLAVYKDEDREKYLNNLFPLQVVAGQYSEAVQTLLTLRELRRPIDPARSAWIYIQYEVYSRAMAAERGGNLPFEEAYKQSFREVFGRLDDRTSARATTAATSSRKTFR